MTDSQNADEPHRPMSPQDRDGELARILAEMRLPDATGQSLSTAELQAAADLCHRLYSDEITDLIGSRLGATRQQVREALDAAIRWRKPAGPEPTAWR